MLLSRLLLMFLCHGIFYNSKVAKQRKDQVMFGAPLDVDISIAEDNICTAGESFSLTKHFILLYGVTALYLHQLCLCFERADISPGYISVSSQMSSEAFSWQLSNTPGVCHAILFTLATISVRTTAKRWVRKTRRPLPFIFGAKCLRS